MARRTGKKSGNIDYAQSTFFRIQGERNMETLIDSLVQWKEPRTSDRAHGPPHLISPQCFLNSTLKRASVSDSKRMIYQIRCDINLQLCSWNGGQLVGLPKTAQGLPTKMYYTNWTYKVTWYPPITFSCTIY